MPSTARPSRRRLTVIDKLPADDADRLPVIRWYRARRRHAARVDRAPSSATSAGRSSRSRSTRLERGASHRSQLSRARSRLRAQLHLRRSTRRCRTRLRRPWTGRLPKAPISRDRFMKNTDCSRSVSPALRRTRPSSCNRWRWRALRRPSPHYRPMPAGEHHLISCRTPSSRRSSMPAKPILIILAGSWTVDATFDLVQAAPADAENTVRFRRGLSCWVTAPAPGKAASLPASSSTTGSSGRRKAVWITQVRQADRGRAARLVRARHGAPVGRRRCRASPRASRSRCRKASYLQPTPRYAPMIAARRFRASGRSSNGWAPISTE